MHRYEVIQTFINKRKFETYLEIGVNAGAVFLKVNAKKKIAVDPKFRKSFWPKYYYTKFFKSGNATLRHYQVTSDEFFDKYAAKALAAGVDVVLVDGMHEYEYAYRDVENALKYLNKNGVIIVHDCNPQSLEATVPYDQWLANGALNSWNGDVWKAIVLLRSTRPDIDVFVANTDFGLGIVTKGTQPLLSYAAGDIKKMEYPDLAGARETMLNLQPVGFLQQVIEKA